MLFRSREGALEIEVLENTLRWLNEGNPAIDMTYSQEGKKVVDQLWLLSNKPRVFLLNTKEGLESESLQEWEDELAEISKDSKKEYVIRADVKLLSELAGLDEKGMNEYIELLGTRPKTVEDVLACAYERLNLITFYTGSEKECNAWTIGKGANVKAAAGVIHTALSQNFISADVVNVLDLIKVGGWGKAKEEGLVKNSGREYIVKDGDYIKIGRASCRERV